MKKINGITLISLIITIIILLILAGITLAMVIGNSGIFNKANLAKQEYENAQKEETEALDNLSNKIDSILGSREQIMVDKDEYEQLKKDIQTLKNQNNNYNSNYSIEEQIIGTWIDGKKIYRKVYTGLSIKMSTNTWYTLINVSDLSIDMLVNTIIVEYTKTTDNPTNN